MKNFLFSISSLFFIGNAFADGDYHYYVDLTVVKEDKLTIKLTPPDITENETVFMFPSMVPGTYDIYNFGRFVSNFKAEGKNGQTIKIEVLDKNSYKLSPANAIKEITYDVEDTWDTDIKEKVVFEPGGSNIEEGKNFCLNTHCFFGYFKNKLESKFILEVTKPKGFYASTSMTDLKSGDTKDVISILNYHNLVDSPIMYTQPDTTTIQIGKSQVLISVFSPNRVITSDFIARNLHELLLAQAEYLGGELPIDKYAFLFYFTDKMSLSGSSGALEHSYSSFYFLPEADTLAIAQEVRDVAAHEFFHIVTPLNIHSKEIGEFDFNNPQMSKHLWLYEGLTEYAAHHMQVKTGLIEFDAFFEVMVTKMQNARENYNDTVPFTVMSKYALDKYKKQYNNVYEKGALIGMCMDIMLRYYSNGNYGTQELMKDLSKKYGKTTSFNDDDLFTDIEKLTYKEVRYFLDNYVAGPKPLPFKEVFAMVGLNYIDKRIEEKITLGGISVGYNPTTNHLVVVNIDKLDEFGKKLKFKEEDEIVTFNNRKLTLDNMKDVLGGFMQNAKTGDKLVIEVLRKDKKGNETIKELKAKVKPVKVTETDIIEVNEKATEQQLNARKAWLGIN
ncbi:MAG: peptidase domain protein [Bacteroidetes bacterium]|jgi:predicted metalloprotease with PDZ domain|nr:peptidase domain protein [Bacteroidota bacterium]MDF2452655.1 peptidase domain protein [Bacteroidota bacterium]